MHGIVVVVEPGNVLEVVVVVDTPVVDVVGRLVGVVVGTVVVVGTTLAATTGNWAGWHVAPGGQSGFVRQLPGTRSSAASATQRPALLTKTSLPSSSASG